jgi:WD40 repeat protein
MEVDLLEPNPHHDKPRRPWLWYIYPDDLCLRQEGQTEHLWAACRCGAAGRPEELGWMGPWCAACHDRAEEGASLNRPGVCPSAVFSGQLHQTADVAFALGGQLLLAQARFAPVVHIWDTATGESQTRRFPGGNSQALAVSADGRTAAACVDARVHLWSLVDGSPGPVIPLPVDNRFSAGVGLAFSPDGTALAWAGSDWHHARLVLHDLASDRPRWSVPLAQGEIPHHKRCLTFSPDGQVLALARRSQPVGRWAVVDGSELSGLSFGPGSSVASYSHDGKTLAIVSHPQLGLWDVASGTVRASIDRQVNGMAFSPDSRVLAAGGRDGRLHLFDAEGQFLAAFRWHQSEITAVAFSPDGRWLATGGNEDRVKLWPVEALLGSWAAHPTPSPVRLAAGPPATVE